jgi:N-methylhydantoinase A
VAATRHEPQPALIIAVDIGGTFTDITVQDAASGLVRRAKTPSTPGDPSEGFLTGVGLALAAMEAAPGAVGRVLHGTTVATNLILEGKGAAAALVTTEGFRHVLDIGRQDIPRAANLYAWIKPARPVAPRHVLEVRERIGPGGAVLIPLDEASVAAAAERLRAMGVAAVAVCLLHSFAHPAHERRVAELLRAALPGVAVTASVDVLPEVREYERSLATVLNARVMPAVADYVGRLQTRLAGAGIAAPLLLMQSNGGVAGAEAVRRAPLVTALSGPAAGVIGARDVGLAAGFADLITVDIGGTSADICLLKDGAVALTQRGRVGVWPLPLPMVDMVTIGAGGGSIARIEEGALLVGPISAGSRPGPACYGAGGEAATVTDAHVVLGHLPASLLGGRMILDVSLAERAIGALASRLGLSLHEAARGVLAIADSTMIGAIRVVSVERGHDPRRFALVAFGGAGPLHGCQLAEMLDIGVVLIPPAPGVLCADGLLAADLRAEFSRSVAGVAGPVEAVFAGLEREALDWLAREAIPPADQRTEKVALMCYEGQGGELAVPWAGDVAATEAAFAEAHEKLYGFRLGAAVRLVTVRVEARGLLPPPVRPLLAAGGGAVPSSCTIVHWAAGSARTALYDRTALGAGDRFTGPAIVTQLDTTTLVPPGWAAEVHATGTLLLRRAPLPGADPI